MSLQVIEGTWEEIKSREAELIGRHLRVTILPETSKGSKQSTEANETPGSAKPKVLRGYGMLKGVLSSEEFMREKHEETLREDQPIK